jgi:hypothetical protein
MRGMLVWSLASLVSSTMRPPLSRTEAFFVARVLCNRKAGPAPASTPAGFALKRGERGADATRAR